MKASLVAVPGGAVDRIGVPRRAIAVLIQATEH
jgi:hypothetical protein